MYLCFRKFDLTKMLYLILFGIIIFIVVVAERRRYLSREMTVHRALQQYVYTLYIYIIYVYSVCLHAIYTYICI